MTGQQSDSEESRNLSPVTNGDDHRQDWKLRVERADGEKSFDSSQDFSNTGTYFGGAFQRNIELESGTIIGGAYRIISLIGKGGMGQVYLAEHLALTKKCALKVLPSNLVTEKAWKRFQTEAKAISSLEHPNLVRVSDLGIHENTLPFFAMEYVEGEPLAQVLKRQGKLDQATALEIIYQVCEGIEHAHKQGIVHRDLKPANIMLASGNGKKWYGQSNVKILDFGLAKLADKESTDVNLTATGEIFGSPIYMSPEQCLGEATDVRSDIYSLGSTMFECLTGHPPFPGDKAIAIMSTKLHNQAPSLASAAAPGEFSTDLEFLVAKMLRKDAIERYQSIAELKADLRFIISGKPLPEHDGFAGQKSPADTSRRGKAISAQEKERGTNITTISMVWAVAIGLIAACAEVFVHSAQQPQMAENSAVQFRGDKAEALLQEIRESYLEMFGQGRFFPNTPSQARNNWLLHQVTEAQRQLIALGPAALPACVKDIEKQSLSSSISKIVIERAGPDAVEELLKLLERQPTMVGPVANLMGMNGHVIGDKLCQIAIHPRDQQQKSAALRLLAYLSHYLPPKRTGKTSEHIVSEADRDILLDLLKTETDSDLRLYIVQSLGNFTTPTPASVSALMNIVNNDSSDQTVEAAVTALGWMLSGAAGPAEAELEGALAAQLAKPHQKNSFKMAVLGALGYRFGPLLPETQEAVRKLTTDSSAAVSAVAKRVLEPRSDEIFSPVENVIVPRHHGLRRLPIPPFSIHPEG